VMRRYPRIKQAGCLPSVLSCTAWGFSCLANYSASGELLPRLFTLALCLCCQRTGGVFSVTLSVTAIFQSRRPRVLRGMLPYGVRTFLQRILRFTSDHLPSTPSLAQSGPHESVLRHGRPGFVPRVQGFAPPAYERAIGQPRRGPGRGHAS
jgi:hypothetical protein